jgi:16S rRNA (cytidine1402-2'-O)-methyltransferase
MSKLYIVPTPIGNLQDITYRAVKMLSEVNLILAEDTRASKTLLKHYNISTKMISYHMHNEHRITKGVIEKLEKGTTMAIISDAGTPGISDPGFLLIRACIENKIPVECLPGATAFVPALLQSGIPSDRFLFEGFLPHKKGRKKKLSQLSKENKTIILYESPHRLIKTLEDLCEYFGGETTASLSRELTKIYDETIHGTLASIKDHYNKKKPKGEIVIVIASNN